MFMQLAANLKNMKLDEGFHILIFYQPHVTRLTDIVRKNFSSNNGMFNERPMCNDSSVIVKVILMITSK